MWLTETGQTACGGDRWASTDVDTFRYLDQLGRLAKRNVQVVAHNTLAASDYGLIDEKTLTPRPNYWAALLWHNTMGRVVLDAGTSPSSTVHVYAACMKGHPGGVTLLALNLSRTDAGAIHLPMAAMRYVMSSADLLSHTVQLNGKELALTSSGNLPSLTGVVTAKGEFNLPRGQHWLLHLCRCRERRLPRRFVARSEIVVQPVERERGVALQQGARSKQLPVGLQQWLALRMFCDHERVRA